jgi:hypothetical protein
MSITITRALAEIKSLDARIGKVIQECTLVDMYQRKSMKGIYSGSPVDEFTKSVTSTYKSLMDMISRRKRIKNEIIKSNGATVVSIGGEEMTVAEAIARKTSIVSENVLLEKMKTVMVRAQNDIEKQRVKLEGDIQTMLEKNLGGDKKVSKDDYVNISEPFLASNELVLLDPIGLKGEIDGLQKSVDGFLHEVDYVLSESNSKTTIEVVD